MPRCDVDEETARAARVVDLFCGAGGLSLGFHAAGCRIVAGIDADERAGETYRKNFTNLQPDCPPLVLHGTEGDLEAIDLHAIASEYPADILVGGPPCQGFSRIGRAKLASLKNCGFADDPRNALYRRFLDGIAAWHPMAIVMENVPGMQSVAGRNVAVGVARELADLGYIVWYSVLNTVWYGVPQFRERIFFVGTRADLGAEPSMPPATHRIKLPAGYVPRRVTDEKQSYFSLEFVDVYHAPVPIQSERLPGVTVLEALGDLPEVTAHLSASGPPPRGDFRDPQPYTNPPISDYSRLMRAWPGFAAPDAVVDQVARYTPRDFETFRRMRPGDCYEQALDIARTRLRENLLRLGAQAPKPNSLEYTELGATIVPPYPVDKFRDKWRKMNPHEPSRTIPAHLSKDGYSHIHYDDDQARSITVREASRLQSFPDAFEFAGNMGDCMRQIGNAVAPLLAWAVAANLLDELGFPSSSPPDTSVG